MDPFSEIALMFCLVMIFLHAVSYSISYSLKKVIMDENENLLLEMCKYYNLNQFEFKSSPLQINKSYGRFVHTSTINNEYIGGERDTTNLSQAWIALFASW